jgi:hypothetical protein
MTMNNKPWEDSAAWRWSEVKMAWAHLLISIGISALRQLRQEKQWQQDVIKSVRGDRHGR